MYRSVRRNIITSITPPPSSIAILKAAAKTKTKTIEFSNNGNGGSGGNENSEDEEEELFLNENNMKNTKRSDSAASSVDDIKIDIHQQQRRISNLSEISRNDSISNNPNDFHIQEKLCAINELQNGEMKEVTIPIINSMTTTDSSENVETTTTTNYKVLVIKDKGKWYALGANCTYCDSPLIKGVLSHGKIGCHLHGTAFNIKTGKLEDPPGFDSLPSFKIKLSLTDAYLTTTSFKLSQRKIIDPMSKCKDSINDPVVIIGAIKKAYS